MLPVENCEKQTSKAPKERELELGVFTGYAQDIDKQTPVEVKLIRSLKSERAPTGPTNVILLLYI